MTDRHGPPALHAHAIDQLFMALGVAVFVAPVEWGHLFMAAGFGRLHIGFGLVIARKYGG